MKETKTLTFEMFRDKLGRPTCSKCFQEKQYCPFYQTRKMGMVDVCGFLNKHLERRENGVGTLIPDKECPIWKSETIFHEALSEVKERGGFL
jgi:hypothetical protein